MALPIVAIFVCKGNMTRYLKDKVLTCRRQYSSSVGSSTRFTSDMGVQELHLCTLGTEVYMMNLTMDTVGTSTPTPTLTLLNNDDTLRRRISSVNIYNVVAPHFYNDIFPAGDNQAFMVTGKRRSATSKKVTKGVRTFEVNTGIPTSALQSSVPFSDITLICGDTFFGEVDVEVQRSKRFSYSISRVGDLNKWEYSVFEGGRRAFQTPRSSQIFSLVSKLLQMFQVIIILSFQSFISTSRETNFSLLSDIYLIGNSIYRLIDHV